MVAQALDADGTITLHSTWRGFIANLAGALAVLIGGAFAVGVSGWNLMATSALVIGIALTIIVTFDYPLASTFSTDGVRRRMVLRRPLLEWDAVGQLTRTRPGVTSNMRGLTHGGLVARVGRRRYLLLDRCESLDEFEALELLLVEAAELIDTVPRPIASVPPTWLYRRAKWAPEGTRRR